MRIAAESTIPASEAALIEISRSNGGEPLVMPTNLRYLAGGGEASLGQVIVTWAQRNPEGTLETYITTPQQAEEFVRRSPGLIAALCAQNAVATGGESVFDILRQSALARLEHLMSNRPKEAYRGLAVEIICADHLGLDNPYLLYQPSKDGDGKLRSRENFRDLASWLLRTTVPDDGHRAQLDHAKASDAIGSMLFEVFKNTEDHALADVAGNLLNISIRAVNAKHHSMTREELERVAADFPPLATWCASLNHPSRGAWVSFLELSVLDSGPGFAVSHTGKSYEDLNLDEEEIATRACFKEGIEGTAKGQDRFGQGLPHVLRLLTRQEGFLRLRTGRLSFFADCSREAQRSGGTHVQRFTPNDEKNMAPAAGSLITILIPIQR